MHGKQYFKIIDAQQAKRIHQNKNIKHELIKTNAAIWFNKICRTQQLCPKYIHLKVNGNKSRSANTNQLAIRHRINQEIKLLYKKKQGLNELLYTIHLENSQFLQKTWHIIQNYIEEDLKTTAEELYRRLNLKLDIT